MLASILPLLAIAASTATAAAQQVSPLFFLASTAELPIKSSDLENPQPPASVVTPLLWRSLASCPTKHYAVIVEPHTLSYTRSYIPDALSSRSQYMVEDMEGQVIVNHVLNTILMDCLHHGVLRVEEMDVSDPNAMHSNLPTLDRATVRKSIIFAQYPDTSTEMNALEYLGMMKKRKEYVNKIVEEYFDNTDYTLIYIRERESFVGPAEIIGEHDDDAEMPFVEEH